MISALEFEVIVCVCVRHTWIRCIHVQHLKKNRLKMYGIKGLLGNWASTLTQAVFFLFSSYSSSSSSLLVIPRKCPNFMNRSSGSLATDQKDMCVCVALRLLKKHQLWKWNFHVTQE